MVVTESVQWALEQLKHEVTYSLNAFQPGSTNGVFVAHILPIDMPNQLSRDAIVSNFEQGRSMGRGDVRPEVLYIAENFYARGDSAGNLELWRSLGNDTPKLVPVGYAPVLSRIPRPELQDIDVFMDRTAGEKRLSAFAQLSHAGYQVVFASGLFGTARDDLIARSKIV